MTRILFVCGKARKRSPTAADHFANPPLQETDFAGLSNDADEPIAQHHIDWADQICVMENRQRKRLNTLFGTALRTKKIRVLDIPDIYEYGDPALITLLQKRLPTLTPKDIP